MKKQLLNELEKEAPFRQSLKEDIIKEANRSTRKRMSWKIWSTTGTVIVVLTAFLYMNLNNPQLIYNESVSNVEQKAESVIEKIASIEGSRLNERFFQLSSEDQLFLTSIYNSDKWEPIGEEKVGYEQLELQVTTAGYDKSQSLIILYREQQTYTTLYSMKGKLTLNGIEMEQFNKLVNNAFTYTSVEKSWYIDAIVAYQPQQSWTRKDPEKVSDLKGILNKAIFSTGTIIDTRDYPDGYMDLFTALNSQYKYRLSYWVEREKILIDAGTGVGEITGEAMYQFIQFLIEEGVYHKGVRSVSEEDVDLYSLIEKLESLPNGSYKEVDVQIPNYILDVNRKVYFLTILENTNQMISDFSMAYNLSDFEAEIKTLRDRSSTELNNFMQERTWEKSKKKMDKQPDFTFKWNGQMYRVWVNSGTKTGEVNVENEWGNLTEKEVETLEQLVRELQLRKGSPI